MKIISDSSCDLNDSMRKELNVEMVPLNISIDGKEYIGDENLRTEELIKAMKESNNPTKTSSPSPERFIKAYQGDESVFVVTLSSRLSSTYSNAILAKDIFLEEVKNKFIHVFDSLGASAGQALICMKLSELREQKLEDIEIVEKVNEYIKEMKTFFVLESLDNLIKNGRISKMKGMIASALSIKPVMRNTDEGTIELEKNARGTKKALAKLVDIIGEQGRNLENKVLGISHCNCLDRALKLKDEIMERYNFKDIVIFETTPISTVYAYDGGIVIAF